MIKIGFFFFSFSFSYLSLFNGTRHLTDCTLAYTTVLFALSSRFSSSVFYPFFSRSLSFLCLVVEFWYLIASARKEEGEFLHRDTRHIVVSLSSVLSLPWISSLLFLGERRTFVRFRRVRCQHPFQCLAKTTTPLSSMPAAEMTAAMPLLRAFPIAAGGVVVTVHISPLLLCPFWPMDPTFDMVDYIVDIRFWSLLRRRRSWPRGRIREILDPDRVLYPLTRRPRYWTFSACSTVPAASTSTGGNSTPPRVLDPRSPGDRPPHCRRRARCIRDRCTQGTRRRSDSWSTASTRTSCKVYRRQCRAGWAAPDPAGLSS